MVPLAKTLQEDPNTNSVLIRLYGGNTFENTDIRLIICSIQLNMEI